MSIYTLPAIHNESLSSWLIRNSIIQGSDPIGWVYGIWGDWRVWTRDIDRYLPEDKAAQLKLATGTNLKRIHDMTLSPFIENIYGETPDIKKAWNWVVPTGQRNRTRTNGMPFCPECLKDKLPYFPRHWRLSWNIGCGRHDTLLQIHCPKCSTVFSPHLLTYDKPHLRLCVNCGFDLSTIQAPNVDNHLMIFQLLLDTIAQDNISGLTFELHPSPMNTVEFFKLLRDLLGLPRMIQKNHDKFIDWMNLAMPDQPVLKITRKAGMTYDALSVDERHYLLKLARIMLNTSPNTLVESLEASNITYSMITDKNYPSSEYLQALFLRLPRKPPCTKVRTKALAKIKPESEEEVEKRMDNIRKYL